MYFDADEGRADMELRIIGRRLSRAATADPVSSYWRAERLIREMDLLNPWPRPRGFVVKAKTREEYARWRAGQRNPRLW